MVEMKSLDENAMGCREPVIACDETIFAGKVIANVRY